MLQLKPPMGWNSWNTFGNNINEAVIRETADVMISTGLRDAGYEYLVIDDDWSLRTAITIWRRSPDTVCNGSRP